MKFVIKKIYLISAIFLLVSCSALGQKFSTHAVKEGETLESIAKEYGVDIASILKYNKEVNEGQSLRVNSILVVPKAKAKNNTDSGSIDSNIISALNEKVLQDSVPDREPIGFTTHKVRKKETIYGITNRYDITENELKKYNKQLYAAPLRKKMELRIPKFKKPDPAAEAVNPEDYEKYIVAPKETRWSIAHKYGITIDSMLVLNPGLSKTNDYLSEGYELLMPKIAGSSVNNQETQLFISYTVPPKMNFYRLEQEFGVKSDDIVRLNPEIQERGGLKEGMVIRIPETKLDPGVINTDNYIFYQVKPKQNEFRLTRKFGMTWAELIQLNPDLKDGLKAGMVLKLPKDKVGDFEVRNSLVLDKINLLDSINIEINPKVLVMLPFRLDKLDLTNREEVMNTIDKRKDVRYSLGLYSGALIALDSLQSLGVSVNVKTLDNELNLGKTKSLLQGENLGSYNAIFGPLDVPSLTEVSVQAAKHKVPVISPLPAKSEISLDNVFYSYTDDKLRRNYILDWVTANKKDENILVIADESSEAAQEGIVAYFPDAKIVTVEEEEKNIGINRDKLQELLSDKQPNWVFVESTNYKLIASVVSILNSFNNTAFDPIYGKDKVQIRMFTTDLNSEFEKDVISSTHLSSLNLTYPSVYKENSNNSFVKRYRKRFGEEPDRYAVRGFDLMYDLLLKLAYKNNLMDVSRFIGQTEYSGNKFDYEKSDGSGYYNRASYIMMYDNLRIKQVK